MTEHSMSPGSYLQERIVQKTREVALRNNNAGLVSMWQEAVKEVLAKFPNLSREERASLRANVQSQVELLATRTGQSPHTFTPALQAVARILG